MKHHHSGPQPHGELELQLVASRHYTNEDGDIPAGWLVSQMDIAAAARARRTARGRAVAVAMEGMQFLSPVLSGTQVRCYSKLEDIGNSSIKITVEVWCEDWNERIPRKVTEGAFVFVAVDDQGRIRPVPRQD